MHHSLQNSLELVASLELLFFLQVFYDCLVDKLTNHLLLHFGLVLIDHFALQESSLTDISLVELLKLFDKAQQL